MASARAKDSTRWPYTRHMNPIPVLDVPPSEATVDEVIGYAKQLREVPIDVAVAHAEEFETAVRSLSTTHLENTLFHVTAKEQEELNSFAQWVDAVRDESSGVDVSRWTFPLRAPLSGWEFFKAMPTCMVATQELKFIERLRAVPLESIRSNPESFAAVVDSLGLSHMDTGVFGLTEENEKEFLSFAVWLKELEDLGVSGAYADTGDVFEVSAEDMAEAYKRLR